MIDNARFICARQRPAHTDPGKSTQLFIAGQMLEVAENAWGVLDPESEIANHRLTASSDDGTLGEWSATRRVNRTRITNRESPIDGFSVNA
jgi:hypothetical protein